jgi:murein DD-endopeptidase MepM/ murein hydrolase activator NlpD
MKVQLTSHVRLLVSALLAAVLVFSVSLISLNAAYADDLDDRMEAAKEKQAQAQAQRDDLENELAHTDDELAKAYIELQEVQAQLPVAEAALNVATKEYQTAQREADKLAKKLDDAQQEKGSLEDQIAANDEAMDQARSGVAEMARQAARGDFDMSSVSLIVGADSTEDFVSRYSMNTTALRSQTKSLDKLRETRAVSRNAQVRLDAVNDIITTLKEQADAKVVETQQKEKEAADAKAQVESLISQKNSATQRIEGRKAAVEQQLKEEDANVASFTDEIREIAGLQEDQRKEEERLEKERREKELEEQRKKDAEKKKQQSSSGGNSNSASSGSSSSGSTGGSSGGNSGGSGGSGGGNSGGASGNWFQWPTDYRVVTSSYGWRLHPVLGYYRLHAGTDMRTYCGTNVYAGRAGTVQWAQWKGGFGNQVLINHGTINGKNVMSSYNHLTSFKTQAGAKVKAGDVVGLSGNTGLSGACHLHFEVYVNGSTIDPMTVTSR